MDQFHYQMAQRWTLIRLFCGSGHSCAGRRSADAEDEAEPLRLPKELLEKSGFLMVRLGQEFRSRALAALEEAGFSQYHYSVLALLGEKARKNPGDHRGRAGHRPQPARRNPGRAGGARADRAAPGSGGPAPSRRQPDAPGSAAARSPAHEDQPARRRAVRTARRPQPRHTPRAATAAGRLPRPVLFGQRRRRTLLPHSGGLSLAWAPARALTGDDVALVEDLASPDAPGLPAADRPGQTSATNRAVATQPLGSLQLRGRAGEPQVRIVGPAGQTPSNLAAGSGRSPF